MDFQKEEKVNYDPHHIISQRKQLNKNKPFDHQIVEGLDKMANMSNFEENTEDFEILDRFSIIKKGLPVVSYESYVDLEVSIREMTEYNIPNIEQWKIVENFGKTKYILHS